MKRILFFLIFGISFLQNISAQERFSLEEAVQYAINNHTSIKLDAISIADAEQQMRLVKASGLPQVNGSAEYNYFLEVPKMVMPESFGGGTVSFQKPHTFNAGISANILAFDGTFLVALKAAKYYKDFIASQTEQTPITLRNAITQAYYSILLADRNKQELEKNIKVLETIRNETNTIYQNGFAEKLDVDRLDLSINNLVTSRDNLVRSIVSLKNLLKFQMNYKSDADIILTDSFQDLFNNALQKSELASTEMNFNNRPEYRSMVKGLQLANMDIDRYKKGYLPSVGIFGSFQRGYQADKLFGSSGFWLPTSLVGARISVPIFDGFAKDANIQKAKLTLEKNEIMKAEFERGTLLELENAKVNYFNALETNKSSQKSYQLAEEIYKVAQVKYKEGIGSSLEVTQAETGLYSAQANYLSSQYEVINAHFNLQKILGIYNK